MWNPPYLLLNRQNSVSLRAESGLENAIQIPIHLVRGFTLTKKCIALVK